MSNNLPEKITRALIKPTENSIVKFHVRLNNEYNGKETTFHNEFEYNGCTYLKLDVHPFITIELIDGEWDKNKSIYLDQKTLYHFNKSGKKILKNIYNENIFAVDNNNRVIIYSDMANTFTEKVFNIGLNQRVLFKPSVYVDINETTYEGVTMFINNSSNFIEFPIDAFESMIHTLTEVNFFSYSQSLINYYTLMYSKQIQNDKRENKISPSKGKGQHILFEKHKPDELPTISTFAKKEEDDLFEGL